MNEIKKGRQTPTASFVIPYKKTRGEEAIELYNRSGRTAQEWQELMLYDIMAVNDENLWIHMKFGWSVPRRNGKSEILIIRAVYALTHGEKVLYTAHRTTTSHNSWEKVTERLSKMGFEEKEHYKTTKQFGLERIEWLGETPFGHGGGVINFRTRSSKGGLGEGYDLLIIDEAQEYTADQESALKYVVTDSANPQTLMCGTPPTAVSSGTVFTDFRRLTLTGGNEDSGWAEWSVQELSDAHNPELWYLTNPALGTILTERTIRSELGGDQTMDCAQTLDDNIQRLGYWAKYNQKSAISRNEWEELAVRKKPRIQDELFFGIKYNKANTKVSLAVAVRTSDEKIFIEGIDCRPIKDGNGWIISYLLSPRCRAAAADGAGGQTILTEDIKNAMIKVRPVLPKVSEVIEANAMFEQGIFAKTICHANQPALTQIAANCEHRAIGTGGGFGYASILDGADISLLEAVSLAHWLCRTAKKKKKQNVSY